MYTFHPLNDRITVKELTKPPLLELLQDAVGGYIETVPMFSLIWTEEERKYVSCVALCNEYGKLENQPHNGRATKAWDTAMRQLMDDEGQPIYPTGLMDSDGYPTDILCGKVAVIVGDEEFMRAWQTDPEEDEEPDPDWWLAGTFIPIKTAA
jgi:hypothetical protein